jgi:putative transposase
MDKLKHNRTSPAIIVYGLYLYFSSRSYRFASKSLEPMAKRTHVSIWKWVQKYSKLADRFKVNRHLVKEIFVDETLLKINGQHYWLWLAYEPNIKSCLMLHIYKERTIFVCYQFFKHLRSKYGRKPVYTDGAHWYDAACKWLRLKHIVYETAMMKNLMERFIQQIKDRTECFDDHFPCRMKDDCTREHVWNWLKMFILFLHMQTDRVKFTYFLLKSSLS